MQRHTEDGERIAAGAGSKAVMGVAVDPFYDHRFACHGSDGLVQIWDARKLGTQPVPLCKRCRNPRPVGDGSSADCGRARVAAAAVSLQVFQWTVDARFVQELAWNPWRRGQLAVSCANERAVRLWELGSQPVLATKAAVAAPSDGAGADSSQAETRPALIAARLCTSMVRRWVRGADPATTARPKARNQSRLPRGNGV